MKTRGGGGGGGGGAGERFKKIECKKEMLQLIILPVHRPGTIDLSDKACLKCQNFSIRKKARGNYFSFTEKLGM